MTKKSYRNSLKLIVLTAIVLTAVQLYYSIQNYQNNKNRFIQEVQQSLEAGIEDYFANRAQNSIYILSQSSSDTLANGSRSIAFTKRFDTIDSLIKISNEGTGNITTHVWSESGNEFDSIQIDSIITSGSNRMVKKLRLGDTSDSFRLEEFRNLTQKVMVSISEDLLDIGPLYSLVEAELANRDLDIQFVLRQNVHGRKTQIGALNERSNFLTATASSSYLRNEQSIAIDFENATLIILKNGMTELVISVLLIGLVIGTLIHLYKTIYNQKQLAAIKDDLISNITHEFKTPIATIFSALEGVTSFNENNDPEKTRRYLSLSNEQLHKLNNMVEKMLETATIDQGKLSLTLEEVEAVSWTKEIVDRFQLIEKEKSITFDNKLDSAIGTFDRFHLENAVSNLIDNAIKYGGNKISVRLNQEGGNLTWEIEDDGGNIPKAQKEKIFEKLYRIPVGNTHDVKGFGIGLYYARKITELHNGQLTLDVARDKTSFKLTL